MKNKKGLLCIMLLVLSCNIYSFRFVQITDTHAKGTSSSDSWLTTTANDINSLSPKPAFVICTGDVTEFGAKAEYDSFISRFKNVLSMPLYCVPGNHDVAWAPIENFISKLGEPNWYFEYGGCWFIGINPYPCGFYGRCLITDGFYNYWDSVISNIASDAPVFIFRHNTGGDAYYTNENKELKLWKKKNTVAIFCGHGHTYATGTVENITWIEADGAVDNSAGNYTIVDVDTTTKKMTLYQKTPGQNAVLWKTIDFSVSLNAPQITITSPQENQTITSTSFNLSVTLDKDASSGVYSVDGGTEYSLTGSGKNWSATVTTPSSNGQHCLKVKMTMPDGRVFSEVVYFFSERSSYPKAVWRKVLSQPVMSSIVVKYGLVYLGCYDGKVYCYDLYNGNQLWSFSSLGNKAVHSSPEIVDGVVYIGSGDNRVYAIDAFNGSKIWEAVTDDAVVAGPAVYGNYVFVGNINNKFYGINSSNGSISWTYNVGDIISAKALVYNGNIYFGCWDRYIYSLTTSGSLRWKKNPAEVTIKNYAPAVSQPYGYGGNIVWVNRKQWVDIYKEDGTEVLRDYRRCYDSVGGSGDRFYIRSLAGDMRCYLMDGTTVWTGGSNVFSYDTSRGSIIEDAGVLYTGSVYGKIAAVNKSNGSVTWSYQAVSGEGNPPRGFMESTVGVQRGIVISCGVKGILSAVTNSAVTNPPTITIQHTPQSSAQPNTSIVVYSTITCTDSILLSLLYYKSPSQTSYTRVTMTKSGNLYSATIPGFSDTSGNVSYYIVSVTSYTYKFSSTYQVPIIPPGGDTTPPPIPTLLSPANGSQVSTLRPTLDWSDVTDPSGVTYTLQVSTISTFSVLIVSQSGLSVSQYTFSFDLQNNVVYYWRVKAVDGAGNESIWSDIWQFVVIYSTSVEDYTPPAKVTTLTAEPGSVIGSVKLTWISVGDDDFVGSCVGEIRIQYNTQATGFDKNDAQVIISTTITPYEQRSIEISQLNVGVTYYFALWIKDDSDNWSDISNIASAIAFDIEDKVPPTVTHKPYSYIGMLGNKVVIIADVYDEYGVKEVVLKYRKKGEGSSYPGEVKFVPYTDATLQNYRCKAEIPVSSVTLSGIEYYIIAYDFKDNKGYYKTAGNPQSLDVSQQNYFVGPFETNELVVPDGNPEDGNTMLILQTLQDVKHDIEINQLENNMYKATQDDTDVDINKNNGYPLAVYEVRPYAKTLPQKTKFKVLYLDTDGDSVIDNTSVSETEDIRMYFWKGSKWELCSNVQKNTEDNTVTADIYTTGIYALFVYSQQSVPFEVKNLQKFITPDYPLVFHQSVVECEIYDLSGKKVDVVKKEAQTSKIIWYGKVKDKYVESGCYILRIKDDQGKVYTTMVIFAK